MPDIRYGEGGEWENYHRTERLFVARPAVYVGDDPSDAAGPDRFAATAAPLHDYIRRAKKSASAAGVFGKGWSFAPLVGMPGLNLDISGLSGCAPAKSAELRAKCPIPADELAWLGAGTTLRTLCDWARPRGRSIFTSGTHLAQTIAGAAATASHGSRLGYGGIQNFIVGMHIVTGKTDSVWIERKREPILRTKCARAFARRILREDDAFEDALVHLGGMGIVNGVIARLAPYRLYDTIALAMPLWKGWLPALAAGDYREIAKKLGHDAEPVFYEATIDPTNRDGPLALHTMHFEQRGTKAAAAESAALSRPFRGIADAIAGLGGATTEGAAKTAAPPGADFNLLAYYYAGFFEKDFPPPVVPSRRRGWEAMHPDEITGGEPGALYNASYAVKRERIADIIPLMCDAVKGMPAAFVYTLRFVTGAAGTLAFTRFRECVVIEIDGLSEKAPGLGPILGDVTRKASLRIKDALDKKGVDYSMHFAKLGELGAAKIERDFGPAADPRSPIGRWRATRARLVRRNEEIFWNRALRDYKLLDTP